MFQQRIKILDLRENPGMGGINAGLFKIYDELISRDEVEVIHAVLADKPEGWLFDRATLHNVKMHWIPCFGPKDLLVPYRIRNFVRGIGAEIIHTRGYRANFFVRTMVDLRLANVPTIITKHGMPVISSLRYYLYYWLDQRPTRLANRIIAVDSSTYKKLCAWKVSKERLRIVPNPVEEFTLSDIEEPARIRANMKISSDDRTILYLGRIERFKGLYELISSHQELYNNGYKYHIILVGDGPDRVELEKFASSNLAGGSIHFLGEKIDTRPYMAIADLVVLPSYSEGMPNVLLEAMSAAKPIVATRVGGIPDLIIDKNNGILIPPRDSKALTDAILEVFNNSKQAMEMGKRGQIRARSLFSPQRNVDAVVNIYKEVWLENH